MSSQHDIRARNKIKTLIDVLESKNTKRLNKLYSELEQQFPKSLVVKSALAYVSFVQGDLDKALKLCLQLTPQSKLWIKDQLTLHYVLSVLEGLDRYDLIEEIYFNAFEAHKNDKSINVQMGHSLFGAYIRSNNYLKQKTTATELWKMTKDDKYWIWCAISTSNQVTEKGENPILNLASSMIDKQYIKKGHKVTDQIIEVLMNIYIQREKYDDAYALITSEEAKKCFKIEFLRLEMEANILFLMKEHQKALDIYKKLLLEENSDGWSYYKGYLDCCLELNEPKEKILPFIKELQVKSSHCRGPFLAEIELEKRLCNDSINPQLIKDYFDRFCIKPSLAYDLLPYIPSINNNDRKKLLEELNKPITYDKDNDSKINNNLIIQSVNYEYLSRLLTPKDQFTKEYVNMKVKDLFEKYKTASNLKIKREESEKKPEDDFLIIAALTLIDDSNYGEDKERIYQAIYLLENAVTKSIFNYQFKLLLAYLYNTISAVQGTYKHIESLNIKNIQFDTVPHVFFDSYLRNGLYNESQKVISKSQKLYKENRQTSSSLILDAYQNGAYTQVNEATKVRNRLEQSIQQPVIRIEGFLIQLFEAPSSSHYKTIFSREYSNLQLPSSDKDFDNIQVNYDETFLETFNGDKEKTKLDMTNDYGGRTTAHYDENQKKRILFSSHVLKFINKIVHFDNISEEDVDKDMESFIELSETLISNAKSDFESKQLILIKNIISVYPYIWKTVNALESKQKDEQKIDDKTDIMNKCVQYMDDIIQLIQNEKPFFQSRKGYALFFLLSRTLLFTHIILVHYKKLIDKLKVGQKKNQNGLDVVNNLLSKLSLSYQTLQNQLNSEKNSLEPIDGHKYLKNILNNDDDIELFKSSIQRVSENIESSDKTILAVMNNTLKNRIKDLKVFI